MKILDICGKCDERVTNYGTIFVVNLEIPEGRFPKLKPNETYVLCIRVPEKKYKKKPKFSLFIMLEKGNRWVQFSSAEESFLKEEIVIIEEWYKENEIEKQSEALMQEKDAVWEVLDKKYTEYHESRDMPRTTIEEMNKKEQKQEEIQREMEMLQEKYGILGNLEKSVLSMKKEKGKTI